MSKLLRDIEKFHSTLTNILSEEFTISMSQILKQINEISIELTQIEVSLKELDVPKRIAESTLKVYTQTQNQINELDLFQHKRRQGNRRDNLRRHNNRSRNCKGSPNAKWPVPPNKNNGKYSPVFLFAKRGIEEPSHKRSVDRVRQTAAGSCFRGWQKQPTCVSNSWANFPPPWSGIVPLELLSSCGTFCMARRGIE